MQTLTCILRWQAVKFGEGLDRLRFPQILARARTRKSSTALPTLSVRSTSKLLRRVDRPSLILQPHLIHPPYTLHKMADEVYDGAIGIDLGMLPHSLSRPRPRTRHARIFAYTAQAPPTLALPTMRAPALRSVCDTHSMTPASAR